MARPGGALAAEQRGADAPGQRRPTLKVAEPRTLHRGRVGAERRERIGDAAAREIGGRVEPAAITVRARTPSPVPRAMMIFGLNERMSSTVSLARSSAPGSQLVRNTSALANRRPNNSRPVSDLMSMAMLRLPRLPSSRMKSASGRAACRVNPPTTNARPGSPEATPSTLITSAAQSDRAALADGT